MQIITDINKLRIKSKPITKETNMKKLREKINEVIQIAIKEDDGGIAAPQVGIYKKFFVVMIEEGRTSRPKVFINPTITSHSEETNDFVEMCLSFPNQPCVVTRWNSVTIKYIDINRIKKEEIYTRINARMIQHEYDHLYGVCLIDKAVKLLTIEEISRKPNIPQQGGSYVSQFTNRSFIS